MTDGNGHKRSLRIAILDFDNLKNPLLNAGQARATFEVGKRLIERGHAVTVITSRYPGSVDYISEAISYVHIGWGTSLVKVNNIGFILAVPAAVLKLKADVILECFTAPISTLFTPVFTSIPVIAKPTSFEAGRFARQYGLPFHWIEKFGCRFYKYFLPANSADNDKMLGYNPKVISRLAAEGVSDEYFQIKKSAPEHILFLGRLDIGQKGLDLLIEAYAMIADKIGWPLVVAGFGPDEEKVRSMIQAWRLESKVKMAGPMYGEKKADLLAKSLFMVMPSRREGFGLAALEAMAAGLPIACFDIPGFDWMDTNACRKAGDLSAAPLADIMLKMSMNFEETLARGRAARKFAQGFSWDKTADKYERFFIEVADQG